MLLARNPTPERLREITERSAERAAKWLEDPATGDRFFWEAEKAFHRHVAAMLEITGKYKKGMAVIDEPPSPVPGR